MTEPVETLAKKSAALHIDNINEDLDIIVTIRDDVIKKIEKLIVDNKLVPDVINDILAFIYRHSCPPNMRISPTQLIFDEKFVKEVLKDIDLTSIPKIHESNEK